MAQDTLVNGNRYSFVNLTLVVDGNEIPKGAVKSINYDAAQDPGIVQGNRITIMGRTAGYAMGTGSMEILVSEMNDFFAALTSNGAFPVMGVDFNIGVVYSINDIDTFSDDLLGVRITKIGRANQQGNEATTVTCDLSIARMAQNGIDLFADPSD